MSEAEELFNRAYGLAVVDEQPRQAIELCRKALEIDPEHGRARVFLGMLLDDHGNELEKLESRQHFVEAIKRARGLLSLCDSGYEESALIIWGFGSVTAGTPKMEAFCSWQTLSCAGALNRMNI